MTGGQISIILVVKNGPFFTQQPLAKNVQDMRNSRNRKVSEWRLKPRFFKISEFFLEARG